MPDDDTVLVRAGSGVGQLTLNRPRAINALDLAMIDTLTAALDAWRADPAVEVVVLSGAGERGLCAGGDVRSLHAGVAAGDTRHATDFFRAEYRLNLAIARYPKPVVALADGITMGGGIGLAGHASMRIVTERSRLAMPETRIGLTPDVGGSWLLARAPGRLGEYLALTGAFMDAADAIHAGFADHLVPSQNLSGFIHALETRADPAGPSELVLLFDETPGPSSLAAARPWIDEAFSADTVPDILDRLRAIATGSGPYARAASDTAGVLGELSPMSLAVTLAAVRRARTLPDLRAALAQEYGLVLWMASTQPDLVEGIRAQLVDKDRSPRWDPPTISDVTGAAVEQAFAFAPEPALWD